MKTAEQGQKDLIVLVADRHQERTVRCTVSTVGTKSELEKVPRQFFSSLP